MSLRNPVKYPVKYYSWQDDQAPQLSNVDGVIKTILKACLVTGYGSKAGAGWTSLFEDAYRIVLRRPLRTGNPPDIKIENGTITGTTVRHRIVAQDNPTGLDDTTELSSVNILARDDKTGNEWHCIVTDFAFLLCYQMGNNGTSVSGTYNKKNAFFVGSASKLNEADEEYFFVGNNQISYTNGKATTTWEDGICGTGGNFAYYDMRKKVSHKNKYFIDINASEKSLNNDFFAQPILVNNVVKLPFFCSVYSQKLNNDTEVVSVSNRQMLRYPNYANVYGVGMRTIFIPLDYWEL